MRHPFATRKGIKACSKSEAGAGLFPYIPCRYMVHAAGCTEAHNDGVALLAQYSVLLACIYTVENLAYKKESFINNRRQHKRHANQHQWMHGHAARAVDGPVSYTHLTLPTILRV